MKSLLSDPHFIFIRWNNWTEWSLKALSVRALYSKQPIKLRTVQLLAQSRKNLGISGDGIFAAWIGTQRLRWHSDAFAEVQNVPRHGRDRLLVLKRSKAWRDSYMFIMEPRHSGQAHIFVREPRHEGDSFHVHKQLALAVVINYKPFLMLRSHVNSWVTIKKANTFNLEKWSLHPKSLQGKFYQIEECESKAWFKKTTWPSA